MPAADGGIEGVEGRPRRAAPAASSGASAPPRRGCRARPWTRSRRAATSASSAASTAWSIPSARPAAWVTLPGAVPRRRGRRWRRRCSCGGLQSGGADVEAPAWYSTESPVRLMKASSSEACCGVSSCSDDAVLRGELADLLAASGRATSSSAALGAVDRDARPPPAARAAARRRRRCARARASPEACATKSVDGRVGEQPAAPDDDQVVGRQRHLAHQVGGDEDRAALGGERLEQVADPAGCPPGRGR